MSAEPAQGENNTEQPREWYVLVGIKGKTLEAAYVKEQFDANKVKIRGAYSKDEILKYHQNRMITNDTILFKEGDSEWKPLNRQDLINARTSSDSTAANIKIPGVKKNIFRLRDRITRYARANKIMIATAAAAAVLCYFAYDYYHYKPEHIYERIKQSVVLISTENSSGLTSTFGSGFVIGKEGIIATNLHVINGAATIKIKSGDHLPYDAEGVVFIDEKNDLALVKIKKKDKKDVFNVIAMGDPEDIKIGERVYAVGNPAGMEFSLSEGIVSGKRSEDPVSKETRDLIQITAPVSPGNSGGPVLDKKGNVVAVAEMGSRNDLQNLNFAVPINVLGDPGKYKDFEYKFLPGQPKWTPVNLNGGQSDGRTNTTAPGSVSYFYNKETMCMHGDNRRVWLRALIAPHVINMVTNWGQSFDSLHREVVGLVEVNCKQKSVRFNILIGKEDDEVLGAKTNFSENNKWISSEADDNAFFEQICGKD